MSEVVKQFSYNSTLENWAFTPIGSATGTRDTTEDSPNDSNAGTGVMQNRTAGKNQNTAGSYWEWGNGTLNWESLGVPAGATVTAVNLAYDWKCSEFGTGIANDTGPAELRDGAGTLRDTFSSAEGFTATTSWATKAGTNITGLSEASSTTIRLRITGSTRTGNSTSAAVTLRQDWVVVTITYTGTPSAITGTGNLNHSFSQQGTGKLGFIATAAALAFSFVTAGSGVQKFIGTGGVQFAHSQAAVGSQRFVGSGDLPWPFSLAATGEVGAIPIIGTGDLSYSHSQAGIGVEKFAGSGGLAYTHSQAGTGLEKFVGSGGLPYSASLAGAASERFIGSSGLLYGFNLAGAGVEKFTGTGGVSFVQGLTATAEQTFSGSGNLDHIFSLAGDGTVGISGFTGSGDLPYTYSLAGQGVQRFEASGGTAFQTSLAAIGVQKFSGTGGLPYEFSLAGAGTEKFTGAGDILFVHSFAATAKQTFIGTGNLDHVFALFGEAAVEGAAQGIPASARLLDTIHICPRAMTLIDAQVRTFPAIHAKPQKLDELP